MYFTKENEKYNRMSFFNLKTIPKQGTITTFAYCKPTFGKMFTHFDSFFYHPTTKLEWSIRSCIDVLKIAETGLSFTSKLVW